MTEPTEQDMPHHVVNYLASLPDKYVGTLYATIRHAWLPFAREYKMPVRGQVADGRDHKDAVHQMLYNEFPNHGKGYTYISWRNDPSRPDINDSPRSGLVENPKPYSGIAHE